MIINAPSLANCNFLTLGQEVAELVEGGGDFFHIDIMDGHYVPNLCFPVKLIPQLKAQYPNCTTDIHLMVERPGDYLDLLQNVGADYVSFHFDATPFVRRLLAAIRDRGMKAGVVLNPSQRIEIIEPVIPFLDYVVLMTVEPGYAGQRFLDGSLPRLRELQELRQKHQAPFLISIDGGVDYENAKACVALGAEIFVTGVYTVFGQPDGIVNACHRFMREMEAVQKTAEQK